MNQTRRSFLGTAAALLPSLPISAAPAPLITDVLLDLNHIHKWDNSNGDTWDPFWADDDNLYAFNCDGRGFGKVPRNLAFNRLSGNSLPHLEGTTINTMDEYGKAGKKEADNATWKACGQECIDGIFYAFVSRNVYGKDSGDYWLRQTAFNSSLIKSTDRGRTWTRSAAENYRRPMWPGSAFGAPFFVHYGQDGGNVGQDASDRFVYAVSTNGFWNDGDRYTLARIPRLKLPDLRAADWTYFAGGDGQRSASWSPKIQDAKPIFEQRVHCGQTPSCYIPALRSYLMVVWYNTQKMTNWFEPNQMKYDFYQASRPWGPWSFIRSYSDQFLAPGQHMYGPSLCAKFQRTEGTDVHLALFTAGCPFQDVPSGLYKAWEIPIILKTKPRLPSVTIAISDPRVVRSANVVAELNFHGIGVDVIADKSAGFGEIEIYLDGSRIDTANLAIESFPRLSGVTVFRSEQLANRAHRIRLVNKTSLPALVDAFQVYKE